MLKMVQNDVPFTIHTIKLIFFCFPSDSVFAAHDYLIVLITYSVQLRDKHDLAVSHICPKLSSFGLRRPALVVPRRREFPHVCSEREIAVLYLYSSNYTRQINPLV